jgi:hypothetical protein
MSIDKDPEVFKLLLKLGGALLLIIGFFLAGLLTFIKKSIDTLFHRANSTDHRVTVIETRCEERCGKKK